MSAQTDAFADAVAALVAALRAVASDPSDELRVILDLATNAANDGGTPMSAICRRVALAALGNIVAGYQPTSYDDAVVVREAVCAALDTEIAICGQSGEDATYQALRAMRSAVVADMTTRGALLPRLVVITTATSASALALAYALYADASRADDLIARANPIHPAWMPTAFLALST